MNKVLIAIGSLIAGLAVGWLVTVVMHPAATNQVAGGIYQNGVIHNFENGAVLGDRNAFYKSGTISPGSNQNSYVNNTGRTIIVNANDVHIGWSSGTATSSWLFYVATSTATAVADYARPGGPYLLIDGATFATSSGATLMTGTSTTNGLAAITLQPGENLIFDVQERYACKVNALCEMATSTNRGVSSFFWNFKATYLP